MEMASLIAAGVCRILYSVSRIQVCRYSAGVNSMIPVSTFKAMWSAPSWIR